MAEITRGELYQTPLSIRRLACCVRGDDSSAAPPTQEADSQWLALILGTSVAAECANSFLKTGLQFPPFTVKAQNIIYLVKLQKQVVL
jgi:hypothetical protein